MEQLLETILRESERLTPEEQLRLAQMLLRRAREGNGPSRGERRRLTDLRGAGKGLWKTAAEVDEYLRAERESWDR